MRQGLLLISLLTAWGYAHGQLIINEACNKNYSLITDEDQSHEDWIELYNNSDQVINLEGYFLTDQFSNDTLWALPPMNLDPHAFLLVYCSGKNRWASVPFTDVLYQENYVPHVGWNTHVFSQPMNWDGTSDLLLNICSYNNTGYTQNSLFNQTDVGFLSTISAFQDGSDASCTALSGETSAWRPNMKINGLILGTGTNVNDWTTYPAPYGNWYWGARMQTLIHAEELQALGMVAGPIDSIAFDVANTQQEMYTYLDFSMNQVYLDEMTGMFLPDMGFGFHTNFSIESSGEHVYLYYNGTIADSMYVNSAVYDASSGDFPDGSGVDIAFATPSPSASNNNSSPTTGYAPAPQISVPTGFYTASFTTTLLNAQLPNVEVYFTLDGSDPNPDDSLFTGQNIPVYMTKMFRARAFQAGRFPSPIVSATYFFNVDHITPIMSIATSQENLYGPSGIFDHYNNDWLRNAHVAYFDSTEAHNLVFERFAGMMIDGGAGGSRSQPQHSMRIEFNNGMFGGSPVNENLIPYRPERNKYSEVYLRNGSNMYLVYPYKDACGTRMLSLNTHTYHSAWRPVSVYINGQYFGLYEMREKFNKEYLEEVDHAPDSSQVDLLSQSYFNGGILRAVEGDPQHYVDDHDIMMTMDPASFSYYDHLDTLLDLENYVDYMIAETWIGNVDWPYNNIKIFRHDGSGQRWRFALQDFDLALNPYGWTDCNFNSIDWLTDQCWSPYVDIWCQSMQNPRFFQYFINRYADQLNSVYLTDRLVSIEQGFFDQTVVEMQNEYARWASPWEVGAWMDELYNNHITYQEEIACRNGNMRNWIQATAQLPNQVEVQLDVIPAQAGTIHISTLEPENYPWNGIYFNGVGVGFEANPKPGYLFSHWIPNAVIADTLDSATVVVLGSDSIMQFTAVFVQDTTVQVSETVANTKPIQLYPVPATNRVTMQVPVSQSNIVVRVYDIQGKLVIERNWRKGQQSDSWDVSQWDKGIYAVLVIQGRESQTVRMMVE